MQQAAKGGSLRTGPQKRSNDTLSMGKERKEIVSFDIFNRRD